MLTTLFCTFWSLSALMRTISIYSSISGYKLNIQKSEAMTLGDQVPLSVKQKFNWKWDQERITYLGIIIVKELELLFKLNLGNLELRLKEDMVRWKMIPLTLEE